MKKVFSNNPSRSYRPSPLRCADVFVGKLYVFLTRCWVVEVRLGLFEKTFFIQEVQGRVPASCRVQRRNEFLRVFRIPFARIELVLADLHEVRKFAYVCKTVYQTVASDENRVVDWH